jgi:acyl carrier protein
VNHSKDVVGEIYQILSEIRSECDFKSSENFIEDGLLDSFDIITLVTALDAAFSISIRGRDVIPENFSSINLIAELVHRQQL